MKRLISAIGSIVISAAILTACTGTSQTQPTPPTGQGAISKPLSEDIPIFVKNPKTGKVDMIFCCPSQLPGCVICPSASPPPCVKLVDSTQVMETYVISDTRLAGLVAYIYSHITVSKPNTQADLPGVSYTVPPGQPPNEDGWASLDLSDQTPGLTMNTIGIDPTVLGQPTDPNNPTEVVYHEFLHFFIDFTATGPAGTPTRVLPYTGSATATITDPKTNQAVTLTYDLTGKTSGDGERNGYVHLMIHNLILSAFGEDKTSALREGLAEAQWSPVSAKADIVRIAAAYALVQVSGSVVLGATPPLAYSSCSAHSPYDRPNNIVNPVYSYTDFDRYY